MFLPPRVAKNLASPAHQVGLRRKRAVEPDAGIPRAHRVIAESRHQPEASLFVTAARPSWAGVE